MSAVDRTAERVIAMLKGVAAGMDDERRWRFYGTLLIAVGEIRLTIGDDRAAHAALRAMRAWEVPRTRAATLSDFFEAFDTPPDPPTPKAAAPPAEGTKARRHEGTKGKTPPRPSVPPCLNASVPPTRKRRLPGIDKRPGLCLGCNENAEQCTCSEGEGERDKGTEGPRGEG